MNVLFLLLDLWGKRTNCFDLMNCLIFSLMQAACDVAFEYAHVRKQFAKPIGTFQVRSLRPYFH